MKPFTSYTNAYRLKLHHDQGYKYVTVIADSEEQAKQKVMSHELCPERAIVEIEAIKTYRNYTHRINY